MTISIGTIQALIDHDYSLSASCSRCNRHVQLDLHELGERLGLDHSIMHDDLTPKLKCSNCGSKKIGLILAYDDPRLRGANPLANSSN